ncbi:hypothetical protein B0T11DRAFT_92464 [Plectosphaerella cucumerina]|jgi:hypothetical protein|uniref:PH domain-like protein n=1 Tax=Plectosphaerella cucumerina TaxID=40658 RepID=A0A8K0X5A5_9PEZI|nr:hypothetical protein B0T11DRAFT_92464 [Plectosphaerella cucumerina]
MPGQGQTPKKRTHARNLSASHRAAGVSDYDSDAAQLGPPAPNPALLNRTNTEINLAVLRRYLPTINTILTTAANAVVYTFAPETSSWERTGTEGTYFLCFLAPDAPPSEAAPASPPRACIFVLNRRGLENTIIDLGKVENFEVMDEIYIFKMAEDAGGIGGAVAGTDTSVVGVWIHTQDEESRMEHAAMVQEAVNIVQTGRAYVEEETQTFAEAETTTTTTTTTTTVTGKSISLSELFGGRGGVTG